MTNQEKSPKSSSLSPALFIAILASISIFMAVITIRARNKIETIQKEHMLDPSSEKLHPDEIERAKPQSPLGK